MLKNVAWEKGFRRIWAIYAVIVMVICVVASWNDAFYTYEGPHYLTRNFLDQLLAFIKALPITFFQIILWAFAPVVISKAFQWVAKGFR
jgi:hypothetical protein